MNMTSAVKWGSAMSRSFGVPLGVKQGGITSPDFFSCYFDDLSKQLRKLSMGCHLRGTYLASIFFADDLCLLAPTRSALQKMMDVCSQFCSNHVLAFNPKKSKVVVFSTKAVCYDNYVPLMLGSSAIEYVNSTK